MCILDNFDPVPMPTVESPLNNIVSEEETEMQVARVQGKLPVFFLHSMQRNVYSLLPSITSCCS